MKTVKTVHSVDYHRNGICGVGFEVVRFRSSEGNEMVGIVFPDEGCVAVLDIAMLAEGNTAFAKGNSWRGDHFEDELRAAIAAASEDSP